MKLFHSMTAVFFEDRYYHGRGQEWKGWSEEVLSFHRLHSYAFYQMATPRSKPEKLWDKDEWYLRARDIWKGDSMLDSGAFSLENTGNAMDVDKFIAFCLKCQYPYEYVVALDVIGNAEMTEANTQKMWQAGIKAFPTFHMGEPADALKKMCDKYEMIGLGGMVGGDRADLYKWIGESFSHIPASTKVHGFGVLEAPIMIDYPWYSVDSTTVAKAAFYKELYIAFSGEIPVKVSVGKKLSASHIRQNQDILQMLTGKVAEVNKQHGTNFTVELLEENKQDFLRFIFNKLVYEDCLEKLGVVRTKAEEKNAKVRVS